MPRQDLDKSRTYWNQAAATFDEEADHGLRDPAVYVAWEDLLGASLPTDQVKILDVGCGTGSLSVLLSRLGHRVTGIDLSPAMISFAKQKAQAAEQQIEFSVMDAAHPDVHETFGVVICRHLLWALPEPRKVIDRWLNLLEANGQLMMIEGYWNGAAGLHAEQVLQALPDSVSHEVHDLSAQPALWGGAVDDERYLVIAKPHA